MTNVQKQCLLKYLGYYTAEINGVYDTETKLATVGFQDDYGLDPDGIFGPLTEAKIIEAVAGIAKPVEPENFWDGIKYFKREEFRCKCGGKYCNGYPAEIDMNMVKICDAIRKRIGKPIGVNSGLRCRTHNANEGGASGSQHMLGTAADLGRPSGVTSKEMASIAEELLPDTGGIGIYSWGIHVDTRKAKSRWEG